MGRKRIKKSQLKKRPSDRPSILPPERVLVAVIGGLSLLAVTFLVLTPITSNDFWLQLKVGGMILDNGEIPKTALFEFTEAKDMPFVAYEWLFSVVIYLIHSVVGYKGSIVVKALLGYIIFGLTFLLSFQINRHAILSMFIGIITIMAANYRHFFRPEIFAYVFVLIHLNCIVRYRTTQNMKWLIGLVPLQIVWVNSHGSYLVGLGFLPIFALGDIVDAFIGSRFRGRPFDFKDQLRKSMPYLFVFIAILASSLLNPYGIKIFKHSWELSHSAYIKKSIYEWYPTFSKRFIIKKAFKMYLAYLVIYATCLFIGFKHLRTPTVILSILFLYLSLDAQRHIAIFVLVNSIMLAHLVKERLQDLNGKTLFASIFAVVLLTTTAFTYHKGNFAYTRAGLTFSAPFSKEAIEFIRQRDMKGNVLNSYGLGSQLIYHFYPDLKVAIDSRIDVFGAHYWESYDRLFRDEPHLIRFLDKYNVRYIILSRYDFLRYFRDKYEVAKLGWRLIYHDNKVFIISNQA